MATQVDDEKAGPVAEDPQEAADRVFKLQDAIFKYDKATETIQNKEAPWKSDPKFFKTCKVNAIAAMKMLSHALAGVEEGRAKGGLPTEIIGLMVGKAEGNSIVIMDVVELPVEGSETQVMAANEEVFGFMARAQDSVEARREEKFIGWYHSHPFDVGEHPNWFFSVVDIATQTQWQNMFGKWLGIVIDPLRSEKFHRLEAGAFMVYPVNQTGPSNQCPDGTVEPVKQKIVERWGVGYNRYFSLPIETFMGSLTSHTMTQLCAGQVWINQLSSSNGVDKEAIDKLPKDVNDITQKLILTEQTISQAGSKLKKGTEDSPQEAAAKASRALALATTTGQMKQMIKDQMF